MNKTCNARNFINIPTPPLRLTGSLAKLHAIEIITDTIADFERNDHRPANWIDNEEYKYATIRDFSNSLKNHTRCLKLNRIAREKNRNADTPSQCPN